MASQENDWIEWEPTRNPAVGHMVQYKLRNGTTDTEHADILQWDHCGDPYDIVAYRVVSA